MRSLPAAAILALPLFAAAPASPPSPAASEMAAAARAFVETLSDEQRPRALLPFDSDNRTDWHYVPRARQGLPLGAMDAPQQRAAMDLLRVGLSDTGLTKAETVRSLELVLVELGGNPRVRDPGLYYVTIFGEPSAGGPWGWRYEGHHLSLHWTILAGRSIASTPQFFGAHPAEVRQGRLNGTRALAAEEDLARELLHALDAAQRARAIVSPRAPHDILTGADRQAAAQEDRGIAYGDLDAGQRRLLLALVEEHARAQRPALAEERLAKVREGGLDAVRFAWMGGRERGEPHYYRIQGRTFLIEYDNTQNEANHVHTVWRDFDGDFGRDLLAEHYRTAGHHRR